MKAPSINAMVPEFASLDWRTSRDVYTRLIGFDVLFERPEEGFVFLSLGAAQLMIYQANLERNLVGGDQPLTRPLGRGVNLQVQVSDVMPIVDRLNISGLAWVLPPETRSYQTGPVTECVRQCAVADPDGYVIRVSQPIRTA